MPGMTFATPILAVLRIPQRTLLDPWFDIAKHHSRKNNIPGEATRRLIQPNGSVASFKQSPAPHPLESLPIEQ
jgi:hypothetical protein